MGGIYEEGNVVLLTPVQHSMWHFANWQLWGKDEDRLAWRGLSGLSTKKGIVEELCSISGKRSVSERLGVHSLTKEQKAKNGALGGKKTGPSNGRKSAKKSGKPVVCVELGIAYFSIMEASRKMGVDRVGIWMCCHGRLKTSGGFHWQFQTEAN